MHKQTSGVMFHMGKFGKKEKRKEAKLLILCVIQLQTLT